MSKRKKRTARRPPTSRPPSGRLRDGLLEAETLVRRQRWQEAHTLLRDLDRRYPNQPDVLTDLANACIEVKDMAGYQAACERLVALDPDNVEAALGLVGAYLTNARPALALRAGRSFVQRWPDHPEAAPLRETLSVLEREVSRMLSAAGIPRDEGWELALQHDEMQSLMAQARYREAHRVGEALLRQHPHFAPALNNLTLIHWIEGRTDQALAAAQQVLAFEPDNVHALANLCRLLVVGGQKEAARLYGQRLNDSSAAAADVWAKKAEAFSFLGDDDRVLAIYRQAEAEGEADAPLVHPLLAHLAAAAALRLGQEKEARRLWQQALKRQPEFKPAADNLADLKQPIGERHGPWAFSLQEWLSPKLGEALRQMAERSVAQRSDAAVSRLVRRFLKDHPQVIALAPTLLERGDPAAREFIMHMARMSETPELLAALKDFALGPWGPDSLRMEAAHAASAAGLLPPGPARLWMQGEWQELLLVGFEVVFEPMDEQRHAPQVLELAEEAAMALRAEQGDRAEQLLQQALIIEPDRPDLLNNLAMAYQTQGRLAEAEALLRQIHAQHPDYLFGRVAMAHLLTRQGDLAGAHALLEPVLHRRQLHVSELAAFCMAQIELLLAEKKTKAAGSWFELWESADPEHPELEIFRLKVGKGSISDMRRLLGRRR